MNGILLIDKPKDFTSHDVVAKMRGILRTKKIGHAGTLDPMATGVLPLFIGMATKACDLMPDQTKRYRARFRLGLITDTQDITGETLQEYDCSAVTREQVETILNQFRGDLLQTPPMYSAVQVDGRRLYDLAREGREIDRPARPIQILELNLLDGDDMEYTIDVWCSKGTYIRTLCHDIGTALGCGAVLTELRRTQAGGYSIDECITLEQAQQEMDNDNIEQRLLPLEGVFASLPIFTLTQKQTIHFLNGVRMSLGQFPLVADNQEYRIHSWENEFLGLAKADSQSEQLMQIKLFVRREGV